MHTHTLNTCNFKWGRSFLWEIHGVTHINLKLRVSIYLSETSLSFSTTKYGEFAHVIQKTNIIKHRMMLTFISIPAKFKFFLQMIPSMQVSNRFISGQHIFLFLNYNSTPVMSIYSHTLICKYIYKHTHILSS